MALIRLRHGIINLQSDCLGTVTSLNGYTTCWHGCSRPLEGAQCDCTATIYMYVALSKQSGLHE